MKEEKIRALFTVAGLPAIKLWKIENKYWPDNPYYEEIRRENPWWLVKTQYGLIEIGNRKRVVSIDWEDLPIRKLLIPDDVTKWESGIHAWTDMKVAEYLTFLREAVEKHNAEVRNSNE